MWNEQVAGIHGHQVIAVDLPGFGGTPLPNQPVTMATYADFLVNHLDQLRIESVVLGGLSMGGYIALEFASKYRDRLAGLVLMDTRETPDNDEGRAGRDKAIALAESEGSAAIAAQMGEKLFAASVTDSVRHRMRSVMEQATVPGIVAALAAMRDRADHSATLASLSDLPLLVMVGAEDRLTPPADARRMAAAVAGAKLFEIEGAGHVPPVERPEVVTEALQQFLDGLV
jgi:pimeloyl-ACP methyl ester carboxylesterase